MPHSLIRLVTPGLHVVGLRGDVLLRSSVVILIVQGLGPGQVLYSARHAPRDAQPGAPNGVYALTIRLVFRNVLHIMPY